MIRGFLSGVIWGGVLSALGLGTVSQLTPLPVARIAADASAVPRAKPAAVVPEETPAVEAPEPEAAAPAAAPKVEPAPAPVEPAATPKVEPAPAPVEPAADVPDVEPAPAAVPAAGPATEVIDPPAGSEFAKPLPDVDPVVPALDAAPVPDAKAAAPLAPPAPDVATVTDAPSVAPKTGLEAPKPLDAPVDTPDAGTLAVTDDAGDAGEKLALAVPEQPVVPAADAAPVAVLDPAPPAKTEPSDVLLKPLPEILPVPESPVEPSVQLTPDPVLVPRTDADAEAADKSTATLAPTPGLDGKIDGVITGRLPRIGDPPAAAPGDEAPAAEANAEVAPGLPIDGEADLPPLQKYARAFENPDAKPLFSIILIDTGGADVDRASLAEMPFPVTFALDPMAPNVAEASKIYRDAGQEVIMVATGIPAGATAADLEVTFQSNATALPEAVAVIDTEFGAFQGNRPLATQVVPILKAQGRGLISWDRGLNAADQVAQREGLASGMVFRKLDGKGENTAAVRRALDRAAFKAAQDGRVMVIGQTLPDTIAALMEWSVEGRATSVALAPVSAVLTVK